MKKARMLTLLPLLQIALLAGCGTDSQQSPLAPGGQVLASFSSANSGPPWSEWSEPVALVALNSPYEDREPTISKDGLRLYFASTRPGFGAADIWVSRRADLDSPWEPPVNLGASINTAVAEAAPALSRDGHWLFFHSNRAGSAGTDIWASYREHIHDDFGWQPPVNLGPGINGPDFDGGPSYFENAETGRPELYFNRGARLVSDIYVSRMDADGTWGAASPVTELNTASREAQPSLSHNGLTMYFDSNRRPRFSQIYMSTRESVFDGWSTPVELGPPIRHAEGGAFPEIFSRGRIEELYLVRDFLHDGNFDLVVSRRIRGQ